MKSILDPAFKYVPSSVHADGSDYLRAKFRKMMKQREAERQANAVEAQAVLAKRAIKVKP